MRYTEQHKPAVTERLRHQAARQLRERGMAGVSVKSVMAAEDMTVGGFYAHFESRDAMLTEAVRTAFRESTAGFYQLIERRGDQAWLRAAIELYLTSWHRDHRDRSCPVATLMSDVGLQPRAVREVFEEEMLKLAALYEQRLTATGHVDADKVSLAIIALLGGALQLSRAVADRNLSERILNDAAQAAWKLLEDQSA